MLEIWHTYLYQPIFNVLIWIYNNWTSQNMGWAIVYLTIMLRFVLLPFTLINTRNKVRNQELFTEVQRIDKDFKGDDVLKNEEIRRILKRRRVQPWSKAIVLGIQAVMLVLIYQVFISGITGERVLNELYDWVNFPGVINTNFYGFELGYRSLFWASIVAIFLIVQIYFDYKTRKLALKRADLMYFFAFPGAVFVVLWWLPMVKSVFILTSLIFSVIIGSFSSAMFGSYVSKRQEKKKKQVKPAETTSDQTGDNNLPVI